MRKPAWLAEVLVQSVMIVLSILLALWVDEWKQHKAEQKLARVSLTNFVHEVQQNQARLDDILPYHRGMRAVVKQLEAGTSINTPGDFESAVGLDGMRPPFLLATAWQTALATGALQHMDYETVSALSLTYTLQDRFREESRSGVQSVLQASNFAPGHAQPALRSADIFLDDVVASEEELRATYAQAARLLDRKLGIVAVAAQDSALVDSSSSRSSATRATPRSAIGTSLPTAPQAASSAPIASSPSTPRSRRQTCGSRNPEWISCRWKRSCCRTSGRRGRKGRPTRVWRRSRR